MNQTTKKTEEIRLAASALEKCRNGDSIEDDELKAGIKVLSQVTHILGTISKGDVYRLTYTDLMNRLCQMEGYRDARRELP